MKPFYLPFDELLEIEHETQAQSVQALKVGFNCHFARHTVIIKYLLATVPGWKQVVITANACAVYTDHWTQDRKVGGGRISQAALDG